MKEQWTEDFKHKLNGFEAKAPEGLLDGIKKQMAAQNAMPFSEGKKAKPAFVTLRRTLAALAAAAAITGAIFLLPTRQDSVVTSYKGHHTSGTASAPAENTIGAETEGHDQTLAQGLAAKANHFLGKLYDSGHEVLTAWAGNKNMGTEAEEAIDGEASGPLAMAQEPKAEGHGAVKPTPNRQNESGQSSHSTSYTGAGTYEYQRKHARHQWQVSAYYAGAGSSNALSEQQVMLSSAAPYGYYTEDMAANSVLRQGVSAEQNPTSEHHKQPVKWGASVRYKLNDRWSIQTGVTYSYLKSTFTRQNGQESQTTEQRLHYVGVPVNVSYSIWKNRHLNVYATAGGEAERLVRGKADSQGTGLGGKPVPVSQTVKDSRPVFSINAAAGIELQATPTISVYAEPGVSRYFDNGNGVRSAYTNKPTNFNLNVGVRVNLNK